MAKIFGLLTAAVVALSLWIGYKNNAEYEKQLEMTEEVERKFTSAQADQTALSNKIEDEKQRFADVSAALEEAKVRPEELEVAINDLTRKKSDLEKTAERNERKISSIATARENFPNPEEVMPKINKVKNEIAQLKVDVAGEADSLESIESSIVRAESKANELKELNSLRSSGKSLPTLKTRVKSVYGNWGFVTLSGGNAQGVVHGSILDVVRDGQVVAKLKVTAVEQYSAAADILPEALPEVVSLRAGDQVVAAQ